MPASAADPTEEERKDPWDLKRGRRSPDPAAPAGHTNCLDRSPEQSRGQRDALRGAVTRCEAL
jgi:hypothetical protein